MSSRRRGRQEKAAAAIRNRVANLKSVVQNLKLRCKATESETILDENEILEIALEYKKNGKTLEDVLRKSSNATDMEPMDLYSESIRLLLVLVNQGPRGTTRSTSSESGERMVDKLAELHYQMATCFLAMGQLREARRCNNICLERDSQHPGANALLRQLIKITNEHGTKAFTMMALFTGMAALAVFFLKNKGSETGGRVTTVAR